MGEQKLDILVKGGEATAAPPLAPTLAPLGVNIGEVVNTINEKTKHFKGIEVPVTVTVDTETKKFGIKVGVPPVSALIKKELNLEKGSSRPGGEEVADMLIEQVIKIAKMKESGMLGRNLKNRIKQILGTCSSMGILVEKKKSLIVIKEIEEGKYKKEIEEEKTELTGEEKKRLEKEKKELAAKIEKEHEEMRTKGQEILEKMTGKEKSDIRRAMKEAEISDEIIEELVPHEGAAAAPETGKKEEEKE